MLVECTTLQKRTQEFENGWTLKTTAPVGPAHHRLEHNTEEGTDFFEDTIQNLSTAWDLYNRNKHNFAKEWG